MDVFGLSEKIMTMDESAWLRHANPWSVYTRFTCLPLLTSAVWSRVWLGWWALVPLAAAILWTWLNPRLFSRPNAFDSWAAKGTFGERIFLRRKKQPVPKHHERMTLNLTAVSAVGVCILAYGLVVLDGWAVVCGLFATILPKLWFVDRMVWLYEDMRADNPELEGLLNGRSSTEMQKGLS